jgi:serine/threonine protein kinase
VTLPKLAARCGPYVNLPEQIGRYQIQSELGKGAMGVVYKAVDPNIGRTVALKTMRLDVHGIEEAEMLKRFKHEAVLAGVMNHPNVITIYDAGDWEGVFYMAMEFMEGQTLQVVLHEQKVLPVDTVLNIARQVCAGLDFAHQRGVIHRDIKPANIMLSADGTAKIMDFGIAKSGSNMTTAGQVLGTPTYMSPEQVRGRNLDGRSDLFSFGVCLYEMVTGEKPFTGQNITTIIYKIMNEAPIPPRELDVSIHPGISAIITKTLAKNPDERYQSGAELYKDLENYKAYGSNAPTTKVMSAAAAEGTMSGALSSGTIQTAPPESIATSHIASGEFDAIAPAPLPEPKTVINSDSTVRQISPVTPGPPPANERKRFASVLTVVLILALAGGATVKYLRAKKAQHANVAAPALNPPATQALAVPPATDADRSEKPSAAKPVLGKAVEGSAGTVAEDTVERKAPPPATTGEAKINSTPAGAKVTIGGASQEKWVTPFLATKLQPGKYDVTIAKAGYISQTKEVEVKAGVVTPLTVALVASGATVSVSSEPAGAFIFLDGKATGKVTPATLNVDTGKHNIEIRKLGYNEENTNISLSDGEKYNFSPTLLPKGAQQRAAALREKRPGFFGKIFGGQKIPAGKGVLVIRTSPSGATIIHNGKPSQAVTPVRLPMAPGNYTVTLQLQGYKNSQQTFAVNEGKVTELDVPLEKK